ncbi:hypothetical protein OIY81_958 [Cryptosporidium canis]|uniref:J domain-containing protein n=1 Tax=Cryptosporidium canis TaxID=195482 RepID=A0ABQ8P5D6_9CRYT|nr:hypothetical protein OJ252_2374 [Cryptosporidium canis]KAJ1613431.1 hypothetical protein OIY81_958 [Cryptosporidium canis]
MYKHSSPSQILSPYFKTVKTFCGLEDKEKKLYNIISRFFNNNEVIHPLSKLVEFLENYNEESSWKACFITLCLFLDHQTIKSYTQRSEYELFQRTNDNKNDVELRQKRFFVNVEDPGNGNTVKKKQKKECIRQLPFEKNDELLYKYILIKLENINRLYYDTFEHISNETEISNDSIILEKSFYDLIGLKYTYCTTSLFNRASSNVKKLILLNCSNDIEIFDTINYWCIERINKREILSNTINLLADDIKSVLQLPFDTDDSVIQSKCDFILKWLYLPVEDTPSSEKVFKSYTKLKEAINKWEFHSSANNTRKKEVNTEQMFLVKSNFQKAVVEFVLERHSEQTNGWYNPFWTLGIDPKTFKSDEIATIKKKLLLFTHPDKILDKKMKEKSKEANIIIRDSLELIKKIFKTNRNIVKSLPKGPELSYDLNSYFDRYSNIQNNMPEVLETNILTIKLNGEETPKLPPGIGVSIKFNEHVEGSKINVYLTIPFIRPNLVIEKGELMNYIFASYTIETNDQTKCADLQLNIFENYIYFEIPNLLYSGYPGVTEISYYIGLEIIFHSSSLKTTWKRVNTKTPTEYELLKGFSKDGIKSYLKLYNKTWGKEKTPVQNMFTAAKLCNVIDKTSKKTDLVKILITLMENTYKNFNYLHI